ncbi:DMT family transporter [Chachezhania antarctica]|uniref:DMT family transporter n=1 Tax=Chachezhania antarctica TaxID=2340860 RepID=UPI000EB3F1DA|nr:DMT family transporter [Chachezhania antarctica]
MSPVIKAGIWMIGAIVSFSLMAVSGRIAAEVHDTFEIMLYRSIVGIVIVSAVLTVTGHWRQVTTNRFGEQILRNGAHFTAQNLWLAAITMIPLAQVFALEFTSPMWVVFMAPFLLGEKLTVVRLASAVLGFIGVLMVARPDVSGIDTGIIFGAAAAVFFALTFIFTKRLTNTETVACILFWLTGMQAVFGLLASGIDGDIALPTLQSLPWLALIGLCGLSAHFCVTNALKIAPASTVVPFDFVRLPVIAVIGMLLYGEALDLWVLAGAVVIFAGNYINIVAENRKLRIVSSAGAE